MKNIDDIRKIKESHENELLEIPGVVGVDIGQKKVDGKPTTIIAIRLYVKKKLTEEEIPAAEVIPKEIEGIPTDVIERHFVLHKGPG